MYIKEQRGEKDCAALGLLVTLTVRGEAAARAAARTGKHPMVSSEAAAARVGLCLSVLWIFAFQVWEL